jgi:hypothetical protein
MINNYCSYNQLMGNLKKFVAEEEEESESMPPDFIPPPPSEDDFPSVPGSDIPSVPGNLVFLAVVFIQLQSLETNPILMYQHLLLAKLLCNSVIYKHCKISFETREVKSQAHTLLLNQNAKSTSVKQPRSTYSVIITM